MILSHSIFGARWPFIAESVKVRFHGVGITIQADIGPEYALNGIAQNMGYRRLDDTIWKDNPETGAKMSLTSVLNVIQIK